MRLALAVSFVLVAAAPFIGELRRWVAARLPDQYVALVNGVVVIAALAVVVVAVRQIRRGWRWRVTLLGLAAAIAVWFSAVTGSDVAKVAAVEHFHFVQYGLITGLFYRAWRSRQDLSSLVLPVAAGMAFGTIEEWWQWFLPVRVGELADVLLNAVAIVCGLLVSVALAPLDTGRGSLWSVTARRQSLVAVGAVLSLIAAFTYTVHVGTVIEDGRIGTFRSRYTVEELAREAGDRAERWATDPPLVRRTLAREDQYRTEGEAHVRARNEAWDAGDVAQAWGENLILEHYYAPVLDTPSHISPAGHLWHPDHRRDAEQRWLALPSHDPFVSRAAVDTRWGRRQFVESGSR